MKRPTIQSKIPRQAHAVSFVKTYEAGAEWNLHGGIYGVFEQN